MSAQDFLTASLSREPRNFVLVGFMGTGKSAIGRALAKRLQRRFFDTDAWIVREAGMNIPTLFSQFGETAFRDMETAAAREVAADSRLVVSTGGGILSRDENVQLLKSNGILICLTANVETILERTAPWESRPLLRDSQDPATTIRQLLTERAPRYALADVTLDTSGFAIPDAVEALCEKLSSL